MDQIKQQHRWKHNQRILKSIWYLKTEACYMNYMSCSFHFKISHASIKFRSIILKDKYLTSHTKLILNAIFAKPDKIRQY